VNLEISDYDLRHVAHLAACEGHVSVLSYLANETNFNFNLQDRWKNTAFDEMKQKISKEDQELIRSQYDQRCASKAK
jgi:hypothetical protein